MDSERVSVEGNLLTPLLASNQHRKSQGCHNWVQENQRNVRHRQCAPLVRAA